MSYELAELERLLANLIRVGVVAQLDEANARVKVRTGGLVTDWLPWISARAGATRAWSAPRAGEQVLVLSPYGDPAQAVALPAIYQDAYPAPAATKDVEHVVFPDGSTVDYNSATNTLEVTVAGSGNVVVNCQQATVNAAASVTLNTPDTHCTGNLQVDGNTTVNGVTTSKGVLIGQGGMAISGGSGAKVSGDMDISGGSLTHNGKNIGSTHTHGGVQPGGGSTAAPN